MICGRSAEHAWVYTSCVRPALSSCSSRPILLFDFIVRGPVEDSRPCRLGCDSVVSTCTDVRVTPRRGPRRTRRAQVLHQISRPNYSRQLLSRYVYVRTRGHSVTHTRGARLAERHRRTSHVCTARLQISRTQHATLHARAVPAHSSRLLESTTSPARHALSRRGVPPCWHAWGVLARERAVHSVRSLPIVSLATLNRRQHAPLQARTRVQHARVMRSPRLHKSLSSRHTQCCIQAACSGLKACLRRASRGAAEGRGGRPRQVRRSRVITSLFGCRPTSRHLLPWLGDGFGTVSFFSTS